MCLDNGDLDRKVHCLILAYNVIMQHSTRAFGLLPLHPLGFVVVWNPGLCSRKHMVCSLLRFGKQKEGV